MLEVEAQDVNINNKKSELSGDLVDNAFLQVKQNLINSQDQNSQTENYEKPGAEYPNENDSEEIETNKIPMKMIQKKQKQIKSLEFPTSC